METINSISKKDISFIINTHFHYDHVDGNKAFGKKIPISHENVRKRLKRKTKLYGHPQHNYGLASKINIQILVVSPSTVYKSNYSTMLTMKYSFCPGHTDGDTIAFFQNNNVIHAGSFVTMVILKYRMIKVALKGFINTLSQIIAIISNEQTKNNP